jgi:hypothetical protein
MKKWPAKIERATEAWLPDAAVARSSVEIVADDGMSGVGKVNPNLVGSPGFRLELHETHMTAMTDHAVERRSPPPVGVDPHASAVAPVRSKRRAPLSTRRPRAAPDERKVRLRHRSRREGRHEVPVAVRIPSEHDDAGGADVQAMDQAKCIRLQAVLKALVGGDAGEETLNSTPRVSRACGEADSRRFRDGDEALVGEKDASDHARAEHGMNVGAIGSLGPSGRSRGRLLDHESGPGRSPS